MLNLGIFLALLCAVVTQLGFLYKHKGANEAAQVDIRHPLRSVKELFSSKWFAIGMAVATSAWFFHVAALAFAPMSVVQAVLSTGVVLLAVMAERLFGFKVGARQWIGVGLMAIGLALLVVILPQAGGAHSTYSHAGMIAFEAGLLFVAVMLVLSPKLGAPHDHHGVLLGLASGLLFGVSDVAIKALTGEIGTHGAGGLLSPWLITCIAASVIAFFASARGLQTGEAVPVITMTSAGANVSCIAGGIIVFGDPMPSDALGIVLQSFAFLLVIVAAALTPAPVRAAGTAPAPATA
jgi:drug/metabolite transporter (DMT)-like permease